MSDFEASAVVAAILALCGTVNENDCIEVERIPGGGLVLSVEGNDHRMPMGYVIGGIVGMAFIFMAICRLAIKEAPKPIATPNTIWMPSPSFVSHVVAGSYKKEDPELQKIEELFEAMDEPAEETPNQDEESLDSIAQEIIDVVNKDTSNPNREENSPDPSPGEPIAKSTPNKEAAGNGMKVIKRVTKKISMTYSPKK